MQPRWRFDSSEPRSSLTALLIDRGLEDRDAEKGEPKFNSTKILDSRVRPSNWRFDPGAHLLAHAASELSPARPNTQIVE
jgi:hypothetical protein